MLIAIELLKVDLGAPNLFGEANGRLRVVPLSIELYHRMIGLGILAEDTSIELRDGMLVCKERDDAEGDSIVVGDEHAYVVNQLAHLSLRLDNGQLHIQTQQPVVIREAGGEPEPDAAIVLRPVNALGKPHAQDITCVIEVAGASLQGDAPPNYATMPAVASRSTSLSISPTAPPRNTWSLSRAPASMPNRSLILPAQSCSYICAVKTASMCH